jgi:hypothetical protein
MESILGGLEVVFIAAIILCCWLPSRYDAMMIDFARRRLDRSWSFELHRPPFVREEASLFHVSIAADVRLFPLIPPHRRRSFRITDIIICIIRCLLDDHYRITDIIICIIRLDDHFQQNRHFHHTRTGTIMIATGRNLIRRRITVQPCNRPGPPKQPSFEFTPVSSVMAAVAAVTLGAGALWQQAGQKPDKEKSHIHVGSSFQSPATATPFTHNLRILDHATYRTEAEPRRKSSVHSSRRHSLNVMLTRMKSVSGRGLNEKYKVDWNTVLGEGAFGSVHPARLALTGEKVALKKISKRYTNSSTFLNETNALLRQVHWKYWMLINLLNV